MKLALIGGGGVRAVLFTKSLTLKAEAVGITELVLHDQDERQLDIIARLCQVVVNQSGAKLTLTATTDERVALKGADYIVTTIRVGREQSRHIDERIALAHGLIGQETTGAAGFSMAIRTIPPLMRYCELAQELAPNAWIFNFSNPSGLVTQALRSAGHNRVIGICDTPSHTRLRMADALQVDVSRLNVDFFGLNHLSWVYRATLDDRDVLAELKNDAAYIAKVDEFKMFDPSLIRALPYLPNEYLYYYYHREQALANILKSGMTRGEMIAINNRDMLAELGGMDILGEPERAIQTYLYYTEKREASYMAIETAAAAKEMPAAEELKLPETLGYAGVMLDFVEGLQSGKQSRIVLSVPNEGAIPGFEDDDVVEISCEMTKDGAKPIPVKDIPEDMYLLMRSVKRFERLTAEAVKHRSRDLAVEALMVHPLVNSYSLAKQLVQDYIAAYPEFLGDWK